MSHGHPSEHGAPKYTNRLAHETSPYLNQHAHNPVDWYPWGEEALARAREEHKPIHLSIGYSACHWCHRLSEESFEDEATAKLLNENFINIKVDREERPDLDRIYQVSHQMLTQRAGGWPLTMFLTHDDHRPFFGGTYFPKVARYGMPAFGDLLTRVAQYYHEHESDLRQQNEALMQVFKELNPPPADASTTLTTAPIETARERLAEDFDPQFGGFSGAPKFPHPNTLERLLRDWHATAHEAEPDLHALYMATLTLRRMGEGGIFDQVGGGFSRYSVDPHWMIPHFEKMLYDNGQLLAVYSQAAAATGDEFYRRIAAETAEWTMREMQSTEGGYYSSFDADSEGHEGKFYVWDREEIRGALGEDEYAVFAPRFGLDREPNFEGKWHLHAHVAVEKIAQDLQLEPAEVRRRIDSARAKLLAIRNRRVWPGRDEKILTSWNAIMIRGMALAARTLARDELARSATRALDFIRATLWRDGRLLATYKDGRAHLAAYLDDYVLLADAILELQQLRFRPAELAFARQLLDVALEHFEDREDGGFFFTADDHETLIHRGKSFSDDATPSGNGIAALALIRMGYLLGETRYLEAAERTLRAAWRALEKYPHAHTSLLNALDELVHPPEIVILREGTAAGSGQSRQWHEQLSKLFAPRRLLIAIAADATDLPSSLAEKAARDAPVAYVCRGSTCSAPIHALADLARELRGAGPVPS